MAVPSLVLLAASLLGACAPDADDVVLDRGAQIAAVSPLDAGALADAGPLRFSDGAAPGRSPQIAEVKTSGDGCPSASVHATLAPDGKKLKVVFSQLLVDKLQEQTSASRDCRLDIRLVAEEAFSPTLVDASAEAFIVLEAGTDAVMTLRTGWDGDPRAPTVTTSVRGPADDWYVVGHGGTSRTTAACAMEHLLTLEARLSIRDSAGASGGLGYINAAAAVPHAGIDAELSVSPCS